MQKIDIEKDIMTLVFFFLEGEEGVWKKLLNILLKHQKFRKKMKNQITNTS